TMVIVFACIDVMLVVFLILNIVPRKIYTVLIVLYTLLLIYVFVKPLFMRNTEGSYKDKLIPKRKPVQKEVNLGFHYRTLGLSSLAICS
ncbi:MAG TPA: hypothetical protein VFC02_14810, partial [Anaerolineales bacterium]|nr:hypothetical protein [Anaerolineales bacterium]